MAVDNRIGYGEFSQWNCAICSYRLGLESRNLLFGLGVAGWGLRAWIGRRHTNETRRKSNEGEGRDEFEQSNRGCDESESRNDRVDSDREQTPISSTLRVDRLRTIHAAKHVGKLNQFHVHFGCDDDDEVICNTWKKSKHVDSSDEWRANDSGKPKQRTIANNVGAYANVPRTRSNSPTSANIDSFLNTRSAIKHSVPITLTVNDNVVKAQTKPTAHAMPRTSATTTAFDTNSIKQSTLNTVLWPPTPTLSSQFTMNTLLANTTASAPAMDMTMNMPSINSLTNTTASAPSANMTTSVPLANTITSVPLINSLANTIASAPVANTTTSVPVTQDQAVSVHVSNAPVLNTLSNTYSTNETASNVTLTNTNPFLSPNIHAPCATTLSNTHTHALPNISTMSKVSRSNEWAQKPPVYTKNQNIETWWKRFMLFVDDNQILESDLRRVLMHFMDDECMEKIEVNVPVYIDKDNLRRIVCNLFKATQPQYVKAMSTLYARTQKPGEDAKTFMNELWQLTKTAFGTDRQHIYDSQVLQIFIAGLRNRDVRLFVRQHNPEMTSEALRIAVEAEGWAEEEPDKDKQIAKQEPSNNATIVSAPIVNTSIMSTQQSTITTQPYQMMMYAQPNIPMNMNQYERIPPPMLTNQYYASSRDDVPPPMAQHQTMPNARRNDEGPTCYNCKKPGHIRSNCQALQKRADDANRNVNTLILNCDSKRWGNVESIRGQCIINGTPVKFLLDTGTPTTVIASRIWSGVNDATMPKPINFEVSTCIGNPVKVIGKVECKFEGLGYSGRVEALIVDGLAEDCLLGMDVITKTQGYQELSVLAKETVNGVQTKPGKTEPEPVVNVQLVENVNKSFSLKDWVREHYGDTIFDGVKGLTQTDVVEHEIHLIDNRPFKIPMRPVPFAIKNAYKKILDEWLESKIIRKSKSPFASPTTIATKKDGSLRVCIDLRRLNEATIKDSYPLPRIADLLAQLGTGRRFSKIDLASGYHQINVREEDKPKTAFTTEFGLFEFNVMPFGLCNAPATFQRMMERVFHEVIGKFCFVYMDDVIIYSEQPETHHDDVCAVLERIRKANLKIKWDKCMWNQEEIEFLGHVVGRGQMKPAPGKVEVLYRYERPETLTQLQSFLGALANYYRRFIPSFSKIAEPLNRCCEKGRSFEWTEDCQQSFDKLRVYLTETREDGRGVLVLPDFSKSFRFETDASKWSLGAVLSQKTEGGFKPVAYWWKSLSKSQRRYGVPEKELLALYAAIQHFKPFLYGRTFTVVTDHKPLVWLKKNKEPAPRLARWIMEMLEYDFEIEYRDGKKHSNADALSRWLNEKEEGPEEEDPGYVVNHLVLQEVAINESQTEDEAIGTLFKWLLDGKRPDEYDKSNKELRAYWAQYRRFQIFGRNVYRTYDDELSGRRYQYVVPQNERAKVLQKTHDEPFSGHFGKEKTMAKSKIGTIGRITRRI
jgi:hypothetical protein